ncbi:MAG: GNAT family N-acetyltransferase [Cyclobacteriaceae bacterium]
MAEITIRLSTLEDTALMRDLAIKSYLDTFAESNTPEDMAAFLKDSYSLEKMQKEFYEPGAVLYLAYRNEWGHEPLGDNMVGFLRLRINEEAADKLGNNSIELHRLYVHPDCKGMGVGKKLLEAALFYSEQHKFDWIWLGVWEKNFNAQKIYAKWGFEKFGEHVFQMGDDAQTDWLLKRDLGIGA